MNLEKYKGIIPAFYACYDEQGEISESRTKELCNYLYKKGVKGLYVGGSSGECIYHSLEERKATLKYVAHQLKGKLTLIAHVGAPSTRDSVILAKYAEELGYDAVSAIPPIYFKFSESSVYKYWTEIMDATTMPFIIYNIPQTTGFDLSLNLFKKLIENEKVIGVKNSSMPVMDIERFKATAGDNFIVFNGPDEQYVSGRIIGADSGIGGTYAVMPELFLMAEKFVSAGDFANARKIQHDINDIIVALCSLNGSLYSTIKEILKQNGVHIGSVRAPLEPVSGDDLNKIASIKALIDNAIQKYKG
ncbi:N-acetylneuraminate lyase [Lysinibacillus sphaericus]|uniref:Dihydrodipicolinate synthase n=1 Tax=Lysinibacillus sphaericus TaxID=1421 RepID=A0A2S0K224_LYSSH|nr:dihydrodipicolinate synthase family protein [Lysinibacillus sphaericus]AVK97359.1 N-acetylneuraminate lyase [Lysinibacillus sphaericus]MED4542668.1 dihydrodipicolinate synthase family protein [Lysinibacillus sphaericus]TKI19954.1 N-acetylneuraminate lyase [Lysinibacillus sphaericus]SUV16742.1 dihydrodipicolinate synthase [Lysinibacillus sphaericus]GEC80456.1 N-acetylneuraminate lyase [Lysinibacillus sphaericus]